MPRVKKNAQGGTRRNDLRRMRARKKPAPRWAVRGARLALVAGLLGLFLGLPWYAISSGWLSSKANSVTTSWLNYTSSAGLKVDSIFITGRSQTTEPEVMDTLGLAAGDPILGFNPVQARASLETLPWVKGAAVERRLPNTVFIRLTERQPLAFFQRSGNLMLVDESGAVLSRDPAVLARYNHLPVLVGDNAPAEWGKLQQALQQFPELLPRVKAATYIGARRWDLHMDTKVKVHLPELDVAAALARLANAEAEKNILERDIKSIDLRLSDRMIIQPTPAAKARQSAKKEGV